MVFVCEPNLELRIRVSEVLIECDDLEARGKSRISYLFWLIQGDSGRVYD